MNIIKSDYDSLKLTKEFESTGFTRVQSEVLANRFSNLADDQALTKSHFDNKTDGFKIYFDNRIDTLEIDMNNKFKELESKLTIKLGSMLVVTIGILSAVIKLL